MANLSLAIIAKDQGSRNELTGILSSMGRNIGILTSSSDFEEGIGRIRESPPQIIILDVSEIGQGVKETSAIVSQFPDTSVFVTCNQKNPDWILSLIRAGAGEYLTKPIKADELIDAIKKVGKSFLSGKERNGAAISVYNPHGGVGASTIAVNLSAALVALGRNTSLIDLNLLAPDIATFLDLSPRYTLSTVLSRGAEIDASFLKSLMVRHSSGIDALCGATSLTPAEKLHPALFERIVSLSKTIFSYTVLDLGGELSGSNLAAMEQSDLILYPTVLSLPALKNAKRYLAELKSIFGSPKVKLVVNRYQQKDDISLTDAEKVLDFKAYACLPNSYADVKNSINTGDTVLRRYAKSNLAWAIHDFAGHLVAEAGEMQKPLLQRGV